MYRGSGFLCSTTTQSPRSCKSSFHARILGTVGAGQEFGGGDNDEALVPTIVEVCKGRPRGVQLFRPGIRHTRDKGDSWHVGMSARIRYLL